MSHRLYRHFASIVHLLLFPDRSRNPLFTATNNLISFVSGNVCRCIQVPS